MSPVERFAEEPPNYSRRAFYQRTGIVVESTCDYCGFQIVGDVCELVIEQERQHRAKCSQRAAMATSESAA